MGNSKFGEGKQIINQIDSQTNNLVFPNSPKPIHTLVMLKGAAAPTKKFIRLIFLSAAPSKVLIQPWPVHLLMQMVRQNPYIIVGWPVGSA